MFQAITQQREGYLWTERHDWAPQLGIDSAKAGDDLLAWASLDDVFGLQSMSESDKRGTFQFIRITNEQMQEWTRDPKITTWVGDTSKYAHTAIHKRLKDQFGTELRSAPSFAKILAKESLGLGNESHYKNTDRLVERLKRLNTFINAPKRSVAGISHVDKSSFEQEIETLHDDSENEESWKPSDPKSFTREVQKRSGSAGSSKVSKLTGGRFGGK